MSLTLDAVKSNPAINAFIDQTEKYLESLGFTDHGRRHVGIVSDRARMLAKQIGLSVKDQELTSIAAYCHDMGNFLGRTQHHYWSAFLFSQTFASVCNPLDLTRIMQAITSHDKDELKLVDKIQAILILADKSDVHRTRVKNKNIYEINADIHDRVNYAVTESKLTLGKFKKEITLSLKLDTKYTNAMEYFEIFIDRMTFCRQAAEFLGYKFVLIINNNKLS
jgi:metal-dependent HD superfamily phosphatase/phosphodiesterase